MGDIEERLATTELFMRLPAAADAFQEGLHRAPDVERLLARTSTVLLAVVEKVNQAHEADEAAAERQQPPASAAASRWATLNPRPLLEEQQSVNEASHVEQLALALDLSQATFLPAVQLFEGTGMFLQAVHNLRATLLAEQGRSRQAGRAVAPLPPPIQRAAMNGEAVATQLQHLCQVNETGTCMLGNAVVSVKSFCPFDMPTRASHVTCRPSRQSASSMHPPTLRSSR